jgi:LDH2 family malate/lactate/ureidoglycolate dehydrogenase
MKRDQLIRILRRDAKAAGSELVVEEARGKGGHYVLRFNGRFSIIQSGEITPKMERTIRKQLGL